MCIRDRASKALLDKNPDPSLDDVKKAIRTDICRCTGYRQIFDAILMAGDMFRRDAAVQTSNERQRLSDRAHRPDVCLLYTSRCV